MLLKHSYFWIFSQLNLLWNYHSTSNIRAAGAGAIRIGGTGNRTQIWYNQTTPWPSLQPFISEAKISLLYTLSISEVTVWANIFKSLNLTFSVTWRIPKTWKVIWEVWSQPVWQSWARRLESCPWPSTSAMGLRTWPSRRPRLEENRPRTRRLHLRGFQLMRLW